jgi:hypothetical protein
MPLARSACSKRPGRPARLLPLSISCCTARVDLHRRATDGRVAQRRLHQQQLVDALLEHVALQQSVALRTRLGHLLTQLRLPRQQAACWRSKLRIALSPTTATMWPTARVAAPAAAP